MTDKILSLYVLFLTIICCFVQVFAEICNDGTSCTDNTRCCDTGCCLDDSEDTDNRRYSYGYRLSIWNMWYFWFVVLFVLMSCFGGCGYYKQRQRVLRNQQGLGHGFLSVFQVPQRRQVSSRIVTLEPSGYTSPSGFGYIPSTGIGVNLAPPPYSEQIRNQGHLIKMFNPFIQTEGSKEIYTTISPEMKQPIRCLLNHLHILKYPVQAQQQHLQPITIQISKVHLLMKEQFHNRSVVQNSFFNSFKYLDTFSSRHDGLMVFYIVHFFLFHQGIFICDTALKFRHCRIAYFNYLQHNKSLDLSD